MISNESNLGLAVDTGGTNVRYALIGEDNSLHSLNDDSGDGSGFDMEAVATSASDYYDWLACKATAARQAGSEWLVAGVPCQVAQAPQGGQLIQGSLGEGAFKRVPGQPDWHFQTELTRRGVDPEMTTVVVNDMVQFAYAAAAKYARPEHRSLLAVALGTGLGTELLNRQGEVWHESAMPMEMGALFIMSRDEQTKRTVTYEEALCSDGLARAMMLADRSPGPQDDRYWQAHGRLLRKFVANNRALVGGDLVVIGGGRSAATSRYYRPHYETWAPVGQPIAAEYNRFETVFVDEAEADHFALYGAQAVRNSVR